MVFFIPMFWGALAVAAGWHVAMEVGAPFPSLLLPRLWAQPDLGPTTPLCALPWVEGVLLQRVGISAGIGEGGEGI